MVLYLAPKQSAGVVSRIATTRKKVEGIKRCSLLFDRGRFLFAKRAFSRFDVLAFVVLLRLFSLSLCDIFLLCAQIRLASFGLVKEQKKKREQQQNKRKERSLLGGRKNSLFLFFLLFRYLSNKRKKNTKKSETFESGGEKPKKKQKKKKPAKAKQTTKRREERKKKGERCLVFVFCIIFIIEEALSLWRLESRLRSLASDTTLESASSSRNSFTEKERKLRVFSKGEHFDSSSWKILND